MSHQKSYYRVPCHTRSLTTGSHVTPEVLLQGPMSRESLTTGSHVTPIWGRFWGFLADFGVCVRSSRECPAFNRRICPIKVYQPREVQTGGYRRSRSLTTGSHVTFWPAFEVDWFFGNLISDFDCKKYTSHEKSKPGVIGDPEVLLQGPMSHLVPRSK